MRKLDNWYMLFFDHAREVKDIPFEWGKWDCCKFSNSFIKKITGKNLIPKDLKWTDEKSAKKAIAKYGTLNKALTTICKDAGLKTIKPMMVTTGDLVLYKEESELVGISDGYNILSATDDGLTFKSHELVIKAWRIDG